MKSTHKEGERQKPFADHVAHLPSPQQVERLAGEVQPLCPGSSSAHGSKTGCGGERAGLPISRGPAEGQGQPQRHLLVPTQGPPKHSQDFFQGWAEHEAGGQVLGSLVINFAGNQAGMEW